jgi:hypothetical protein
MQGEIPTACNSGTKVPVVTRSTNPLEINANEAEIGVPEGVKVLKIGIHFYRWAQILEFGFSG